MFDGHAQRVQEDEHDDDPVEALGLDRASNEEPEATLLAPIAVPARAAGRLARAVAAAQHVASLVRSTKRRVYLFYYT